MMRKTVSSRSYYSGGVFGGGTTNTIDVSAVANPAPQGVYQTEHLGICTYTVPHLNTALNYTVRLHFAELYWTASGKRTFNVLVNNLQLLTSYDIYADTCWVRI